MILAGIASEATHLQSVNLTPHSHKIIQALFVVFQYDWSNRKCIFERLIKMMRKCRPDLIWALRPVCEYRVRCLCFFVRLIQN